jgi:CRP/FNR family transcriptional regulator
VTDPELWGAIEAGPLADLPVPVITQLLQETTLLRSQAGTTFYRPGDPAGLHFVVHGLVRIVLTSSEGRSVTVRYARRGELLGAPIVVAGGAPVSAEAVTDITVARTPPGRMASLARNDSRVALWLAEELARRVDGLLHELGANTFLPVRARLARHMLDLSTHERDGTLSIRASQQQLADATGTVREVAARILKGFKEAGLIHTGRDQITVLDAASLADLARGAH